MTDENQDAARDGDAAPRATFIDSDVRARLVDVARQAGLDADEFVEKLLLRLAETGVEFERGVCASGLSRRGRMMLASSASVTWPMTHEQLLDHYRRSRHLPREALHPGPEGRCLVTLDKGFSDPVGYPPRQFAGIVVVRLPGRFQLPLLERALALVVEAAKKSDVHGRLWIAEADRVREYHDRSE